MNLAAMLRRRAAETPEHPAILFEGATITYGELDARASRLAHALRAHGVGPADRVALYLPNMPDFAVAYYATQLLGAITVSINAIFKAAEVEYLLDDSTAAVVLTLAELAGFVPRERCPAVRHVVVCDGTPGAAPAGTDSLADWLAAVPAQAGAFAPLERRGDDPAALLYSSGTTGFPKGVTLTQHNIATNVATAAAASGYRADDRLALFLPLFHVYGQNYILNGAVHAGATVALFRRFAPDLVLDAIERDRITMFFGVPTVFIGLLGMDLARRDLSSIRYEMSAASTMPEAVSRRWTERFGRRIFEGYGLTECSPFAAYNDALEHRFGSVGRAVEGFEIAIHDEQGSERPRGDWGEIVIRSLQGAGTRRRGGGASQERHRQAAQAGAARAGGRLEPSLQGLIRWARRSSAATTATRSMRSTTTAPRCRPSRRMSSAGTPTASAPAPRLRRVSTCATAMASARR